MLCKDSACRKEDGTNIFSQNFLDGILSLSICLLILLSSFQLTCSALSFGICYLSGIFPKKSFAQSQKRDNQQDSFQKKKLCQLDLVPSLSFTGFSQNRSRSQLQSASFSQLDLQTSLSFLLLASISFSNQLQAESFCRTRINTELQTKQVQSFQLSIQQLCLDLVSGRVPRAFHQPALQTRVLIAAWTLMSLSLAMNTWLKTSSNKAWRRRPFRQRLSTASTLTSLSLAQDAWLKPYWKRTCRRRTSNPALTWTSLSLAKEAWLKTSNLTSWSTTSSHRSASMRPLQTPSTRTSTRSLTRPLLSIFLLSFMFNNFFFNNSFETCPLGLLQWPSWTRNPQLRSASGSQLH